MIINELASLLGFFMYATICIMANIVIIQRIIDLIEAKVSNETILKYKEFIVLFTWLVVGIALMYGGGQ